MTKEELRELDAWIAENIFELKTAWVEDNAGPRLMVEDGSIAGDALYYSTKIEHTYTLIKFLRFQGVQIDLLDYRHEWHCSVSKDDSLGDGWDPSLPIAVCKAVRRWHKWS